jgi:type III secretion system YscD/HrpQ family protein
MGGEILFTIFTGAHAGAEARFPPGEYVLGSSEECDLILRDSGIAGRHCSLLVPEKGLLRLTPLEGTLLLEGEARSDPFELPAATPILAGLVCFAWVREGQSWGNMRLPSLLGEGNSPAGEDKAKAQEAAAPAAPPAGVKAAPAPPPEEAPPPQAKRPRARLLAAGVAVLLLLALSVNLLSPGEEEKPAEKLAAELREAGFPELGVSENNSRVVVHGLVPTPNDANKVRSIASAQAYPVQIMVRDKEDFIRSVQTLLAVHGLYPQVRFDGTEAVLAGYALDALTARAALAWAREAAGFYAELRSALLTRAEVEETLLSELARSGLDKKISLEWQPGVIFLSGPGLEDPALPEVMRAVRETLASPIAFRKKAPPSETFQSRTEPEPAALRPTQAENLSSGPQAPEGGSDASTPRILNPDLFSAELFGSGISLPTPFIPEFFTEASSLQPNPFGDSLGLRGVTPTRGSAGSSGPSFITLSDGRVFFTGGVLPSGYVLTGIYPDRLEFSKNGSTLAYKLQGR